MTQATIARRAPEQARTRAPEHQGHVALTGPRTSRAAQKHKRTKSAEKHPGFNGGNIKMPAIELVHVWSSLLSRSVLPYDVRTWLACREVFEERKFASRGVVPVYKLSELVTLIGGGGERQVRASLRRLHKAGLITWRGTKGPRFHASKDLLTKETLPFVEKMEALMPEKREFFPMPRPMLRLLAGGVKRSVLVTVFAHLLRCPHLSGGKWNPVGTCAASWMKAAFGLSLSAVREARAHLIHQLGWLSPRHADQPQWHKNKYGGRFAVNLDWEAQTPTMLAQQDQGIEFSTAESGCPNPRIEAESGCPESEQLLLRNSKSDLEGKPSEHPSDFFNRTVGQVKPETSPAPSLANLVPADLSNVARVMELFDQALVNPRWRERGWTPREDSHLERLNWAAAARRAHVRGSTKPCGVFVHLVSHRKWEHISNEDEDAVRAAFSRWATPEAVGAENEQRGGLPELRNELSTDGAVIRRIENTLRERAPMTSRTEVDGYLKQQGWLSARIDAARESFINWRRAQDELVAE